MAGARRKHHKIPRVLPPDLVEAVNRKLVEGHTYQEIADWLGQMGHQVGKSSVGRYGKEFLTRLERLRQVRDQARVIIDEGQGAPATELHEATNQLAIQLIMETLLQLDTVQGEKVADLLKALAQLEKSAVAREGLKLDYRQKVDKAVKQIEETGKKKGLDPETLALIKEQVYGIV